MWNPDEVNRRDEIVSDFLEKAFGPAQEPMAEFYDLIDGSNKSDQLVYDSLLAKMYRQLEKAKKLAAGNQYVIRRIDDLILYTRHAELYDEYRTATGPARQAAYEAMIRHSYRIRDTFMVHSLALWRDVDRRDAAVGYPEEASWTVKEEENPWKDGTPYSQAEIAAILKNGVANHEPIELDFEPRTFSDENLVPAKKLFADLESNSPGNAAAGRGTRSFFTVVEQAPHTIELQITGGLDQALSGSRKHQSQTLEIGWSQRHRRAGNAHH